MSDFDFDDEQLFQERPWIKWETTYEIEAWIDGYNRDLQKFIKNSVSATHAICFALEAGGEIFLHTSPEGMVLVDVPPEAEWIAPLLTAVTGTEPPKGQVWMMQVDKLTQLILGLSSLIKSTRFVPDHPFKFKRTL